MLYSIGSKPLAIWDSQVRNGHIKRITDGDIQSSVLEICGTNVSTTYITCPADAKKTLGIKLPFLVMILKNLKKYFTFEVTVLDDKNVRRRFRASNYQSTTRVKPFICSMPMRLDEGWNQIQFNLADFCRRAYGTNYIETLRIQIHANCRVRRIYFSDRLYAEEDLPAEFKLYLPISKQAAQAQAHAAAAAQAQAAAAKQSQHAAAAAAAAAAVPGGMAEGGVIWGRRGMCTWRMARGVPGKASTPPHLLWLPRGAWRGVTALLPRMVPGMRTCERAPHL